MNGCRLGAKLFMILEILGKKWWKKNFGQSIVLNLYSLTYNFQAHLDLKISIKPLSRQMTFRGHFKWLNGLFSSARQSTKRQLMTGFSFWYLGFKIFWFIIEEILQIKFNNFHENKKNSKAISLGYLFEIKNSIILIFKNTLIFR